MEEQDGEQRARGMMARMRELEHGPEQRMRDTFFRVHQLLTRQESLHSERWHLKRKRSPPIRLHILSVFADSCTR